jgi:hypothetical protein
MARAPRRRRRRKRPPRGRRRRATPRLRLYHARVGRREDDQLLRELRAPNVEEAVGALGYWLRRHERLPFYRRSARAEARRMIEFWQGRALTDVAHAPLSAAANARVVIGVTGQLVAYRAARVLRRGAVTVGALAALIAVVALR